MTDLSDGKITELRQMKVHTVNTFNHWMGGRLLHYNIVSEVLL